MTQIEQVKYSDLLRFFEVYPEVSYIYDNTMSEEVYSSFVANIENLIKDKKFPTSDVCKVFNVMVRISPFAKEEQDQKFLTELVGRIRHSIYDIPKEHFALTMSNLIEFQQPHIAAKFVNILKEITRQGKNLSDEFSNKELIQIYWSLL